MENNYIYTLSDYFCPAFITAFKKCFGNAAEREKITDRDRKDPIKATILHKKSFKSSDEVFFSFYNIYGCEYSIKMTGYAADILLVEYENEYGIYTCAEIENPGYYCDITDKYVPLNRRFWGLPGQIQINSKENDNYSLSTALAYMGEQFDVKNEAIEYFNNITEPNFSGFFEDVFGDG